MSQEKGYKKAAIGNNWWNQRKKVHTKGSNLRWVGIRFQVTLQSFQNFESSSLLSRSVKVGTLQIELNSHDSAVEFQISWNSKETMQWAETALNKFSKGRFESGKGEVGSLWVEGMGLLGCYPSAIILKIENEINWSAECMQLIFTFNNKALQADTAYSVNLYSFL